MKKRAGLAKPAISRSFRKSKLRKEKTPPRISIAMNSIEMPITSRYL